MKAYPGDLLDHVRTWVTVARAVEAGPGRGAPHVRAASELAVDVSIVRRRLATLTEHVGAPLLRGRGSRASLTPAGERIRARGEELLGLAGSLGGDAPARAAPLLRVAATGAVLGELVPPALRRVRAAYPEVLLRVRRAGADTTRALVLAGDVDLGVVRSELAPEGVASTRLGEDRLWLALPRRSLLARRRGPLRTAELARAPLVGYGPSSATMRRVLAVLGPLGAEPWIEVEGKASALRYVAEGLGIAFVSTLATGPVPRAAGVVLRDVTSRFGRTSFWLVWKPDATFPATSPARTFARQLGASLGR